MFSFFRACLQLGDDKKWIMTKNFEMISWFTGEFNQLLVKEQNIHIGDKYLHLALRNTMVSLASVVKHSWNHGTSIMKKQICSKKCFAINCKKKMFVTNWLTIERKFVMTKNLKLIFEYLIALWSLPPTQCSRS